MGTGKLKSMFLALLLCAASACGQLTEKSSTKDIIPPNSLEPIENVKGTPFYTASRSIARASLDGYCTSIRVAEDLFLTNNHCFLDTTCERTTFTLAFEAAIPDRDRPVFQCKEVVATHFMLDYSIARVEEVTHLGTLRDFPPAVLSRAEPREGQKMFVSGHPKGRKKEIDRSDQCQVVESSFDGFEHTCDTEEGSSGAPLFDKASLHVMGLNWGGGGTINGAKPISSILEDIKQQNSAVYSKLTVAD